MGKGSVNIKIAGDFVITKDDYSAEHIDDKVLEIFRRSDLNIVNLESPITNDAEKIAKTGPHLKGKEKPSIEALQALRIGLVTLANNHILDYGQKGLTQTLNFCSENQIDTVGGGIKFNDARRAYRKSLKGHRISIINFAENEWSSASASSGGANPMDLIENVKQIQEEKKVSDKVIVIVHGGHEYYHLPSPRMKKQYRFYVDNGADLVVGHHTHCISGNEVYNGAPIFYGLGNFLFTLPSELSEWYLGLVLEIEIDPSGNLSTALHPIHQKKGTYDLSLCSINERNKVFEEISSYSATIKDDEKLLEQWRKYITEKTETYTNYWSPISFIRNGYIKTILNKIGVTKMVTPKYGVSLLLNLMRCEAHSDLSKEILSKNLGNK